MKDYYHISCNCLNPIIKARYKKIYYEGGPDKFKSIERCKYIEIWCNNCGTNLYEAKIQELK